VGLADLVQGGPSATGANNQADALLATAALAVLVISTSTSFTPGRLSAGLQQQQKHTAAASAQPTRLTGPITFESIKRSAVERLGTKKGYQISMSWLGPTNSRHTHIDARMALQQAAVRRVLLPINAHA
jgi:hypothetical protein